MESIPLHTRFFRVDPLGFAEDLKRWFGIPPSLDNMREEVGLTNTVVTPPGTIVPLIRNLCSSAGVSLDAPGKALFYNDRLGVVMVRATLDDLEKIEPAMKQFVAATKLINPRVELRVQALDAPVVPGSNGSFIFGRNPRLSTNTLLDMAGTNTGPVRLLGTLSPDQAASFLSSAQQVGGADMLKINPVTTSVGRQAQVKVVDVRYIVTDLDSRTNSAPTPVTTPFELGPIVDVVPGLAPDGYTMNLAVSASVREFLGYAKPPANDRVAKKFPGAVTPLPRFRVRQAAATNDVLDGSTMIIGGGVTTNIYQTTTKILGFFERRQTWSEPRALYFLVTPRLIDSAGNPIHTDTELAEKRREQSKR
jgi:hypothetical protein